MSIFDKYNKMVDIQVEMEGYDDNISISDNGLSVMGQGDNGLRIDGSTLITGRLNVQGGLSVNGTMITNQSDMLQREVMDLRNRLLLLETRITNLESENRRQNDIISRHEERMRASEGRLNTVL